MDSLIRVCIELDRLAADTYARLANSCVDPELARIFEVMGVEERAHVSWWTDLLGAWEEGLLPALVDLDELWAELQTLDDAVRQSMPDDLSVLSPDEMLTLAARLEFYMLDPAFSELIGLIDPGVHGDVHEAYARHVLRIVTAIETRTGSDALTHVLALALSRSLRDQRRLKTLATHDLLTGIFNRRGFYAHLDQWTAWSARYHRPIAVLLVDIDHFKLVNDTFGHPVGDAVLQAVAAALGSAVRSADVVGRHGGDEFAVLAPEADAEEAAILAARVLEVVRERTYRAPGEMVNVTVSVGIACASGKHPVRPEQLFIAADRSLYEAKVAGRNRAGTAHDADSV